MKRHDAFAWAAVVLPVAVGVGLTVLGIEPTQVVALEGALVAEGATVERQNPVFYGLVFISCIVSAVLIYADTETFDDAREALGKWRHVMALGTALFYLPVLWYYWERRKVANSA